MISMKPPRRGNKFINRKFQTGFALKFLLLIVLESALAIGLFWYLSKGAIITGYAGSELVVTSAGKFFLPNLLIANLVIVGITAFAGFFVFLLISHKLAGPLYRFEQALEQTSDGDLTSRFVLRENDQMHSVAKKMNELNMRMESGVSDIQRELSELNRILAEIRAEVNSNSTDKAMVKAKISDALNRMEELGLAANFFKTMYNKKEL